MLIRFLLVILFCGFCFGRVSGIFVSVAPGDLIASDLIIFAQGSDFRYIINTSRNDFYVEVSKYITIKGTDNPKNLRISGFPVLDNIGKYQYLLFCHREGSSFSLAGGGPYGILKVCVEPTAGDFLTTASFHSYLEKEWSAETNDSNLLYLSLLLSDAPKEELRRLWVAALQTPKGVTGFKAMAALNLGVRVDGLDAFSKIPPSVLEKPIINPDSGVYYLSLQGALDEWMASNVNDSNASQVLALTQSCPCLRKSIVLNSLVGKLPLANLQDLLKIMNPNADMETLYTCGKIMANMLQTDEIEIPPYREFRKNPSTYTGSWMRVARAYLEQEGK